MANFLRRGGGGGLKKDYLFKDGVFKITPTQSNMNVVNGELTGGYYLDIPYEASADELVCFEIYKPSSTTVDCNLKISTTAAPITNGNGDFQNTAIRNSNASFSITMIIPGGSRVSYCCHQNAKSLFYIKSIFVVKDGFLND